MTEKLIWKECLRCTGKGHIRGFEAVAGGVCFQCGGTRGRNVTVAAANRATKARAARIAKADAARLEAAAQWRAEVAAMTMAEKIEWIENCTVVGPDGMTEIWADDTRTDFVRVTVAEAAARL